MSILLLFIFLSFDLSAFFICDIRSSLFFLYPRDGSAIRGISSDHDFFRPNSYRRADRRL